MISGMVDALGTDLFPEELGEGLMPWAALFLNDSAAIHGNVVLRKVGQSASHARENVLCFSRIECCNGPS